MSTYPQGPALYEPTQDERTMALLAYILGIFSGFIAPLVLYLVKKDSKFVSFHSLQALAWHVVYVVCFFGAMMIFVLSMIASGAFAAHGKNEPPLAFFGIFGVFWLVAIGGAVLNIVLGIVYGIRANKGEWAEFPLLGSWVLRKIVF